MFDVSIKEGCCRTQRRRRRLSDFLFKKSILINFDLNSKAFEVNENAIWKDFLSLFGLSIASYGITIRLTLSISPKMKPIKFRNLTKVIFVLLPLIFF